MILEIQEYKDLENNKNEFMEDKLNIKMTRFYNLKVHIAYRGG